MPVPSAPADIREHLAAERTLLAYVRTGLALMGLGFVVARFGLFLGEIQLAKINIPARSTGASVIIGTVLVLLGVLLNFLAARQYANQVRRLNQTTPPGYPVSWVAIGVSSVLAAVGIGIAIYLLALSY